MISEDIIINTLRTVNDPELHQDLVSLGMVEKVALDAGNLQLTIKLTTPACPLKGKIEADIRSALSKFEDIKDIKISFTAQVRGAEQQPLPGIKNIIAIGSGKGGVGKSTVAANLAVSLALEGAEVGLLDADIYGPSQAKMFEVEGKRLLANEEKRILPLRSHNIKVVSIANLVEEGQALTWRGPILHGTLTQLLKQTFWGELDYLIIDLPPGTGDVQLSLSQLVPVTGAILVTTPQEVALADVKRSYTMFRKTNIPVMGIVENMSYYQLPDGSHDYIFGQGSLKKFADEERLTILEQIPLASKLRASSDEVNL